MTEAVKGPRSYFPSIEKKYGHPIAHWMTLPEEVKGARHLEQVAFLKTQHGHGHAKALVAVFRVDHGL